MSETYYLKTAPAPYTNECCLKQFQQNEYHCTRMPDHFTLIFMLKNTLYWNENSVPCSIQSGEWYLQPKNVRQSAQAPSSEAEYYYIHLYAETGTSLEDSLKLPAKGTFHAPDLLPALRELAGLTSQRPFRFLDIQIALYGILKQLQEQSLGYDKLVYRVIRYLDAHYCDKITSQTLSREFHYSREYIEATVKKQLQMTPHAYLTQIRLDKVRRLLEYSDTPVSEIAGLTGFGDTSLLFRAFKQRYGMSPSSWREQNYPGA